MHVKNNIICKQNSLEVSHPVYKQMSITKSLIENTEVRDDKGFYYSPGEP